MNFLTIRIPIPSEELQFWQKYCILNKKVPEGCVMKSKDSMTKSYDTCHILEEFIRMQEQKYRIRINFYDVAGMRNMNPNFERIFAPYTSHENYFCKYIKQNTSLFPCVENRMKLCGKCRNVMAPFYGMCPFGIEEFVFPILAKDELLGIFCIGMFSSDLDSSLGRLKNSAEYYGLDYEKCKSRFFSITQERQFDPEELAKDISVLAELTAYACLKENLKPFDSKNIQLLHQYKENSIVDDTISFIQDNIDKNLSLKTLAANSFCNPNYLSSLFMKKMNQSVVDYINNTRISISKKYLAYTGQTVSSISEIVGYNSPSYFAYIFKKTTGLSPKEYRQSFR